MADTGWKSPTATGAVYNDFTNPTYAYSSNDQYATRLMANGSTFRQSYSGFGFGVPAGATINGIEVSIEGHGSVQIALPHYIHNESASNNRLKYFTHLVSDSAVVEGGASDLWSGTWVADDFSDESFYMYLTTDPDGTDGITISIDHIQVKVYYTEATVVNV
ncbi:MAG: hypothetical protein WC554_18110, partial [Clostridia bacterium]